MALDFAAQRSAKPSALAQSLRASLIDAAGDNVTKAVDIGADMDEARSIAEYSFADIDPPEDSSEWIVEITLLLETAHKRSKWGQIHRQNAK